MDKFTAPEPGHSRSSPRAGLSAAMRWLMTALLVSVLAGSLHAQSSPTQLYDHVDTYLDYRIYDLPPSVVHVSRFGEWSKDGEQGMVRVIINDAGEPLAQSHHLLTLQWVCDCEAGLVSVVPVSELNRDGPFIYTRPEAGQRGQTWYLEMAARNTRTGDESLVRLFVPRVGEYRVEYDTLRR